MNEIFKFDRQLINGVLIFRICTVKRLTSSYSKSHSNYKYIKKIIKINNSRIEFDIKVIYN